MLNPIYKIQSSITSINSHLYMEPFVPPVPLFLCLLGAGVVIVFTFVLVALFSRIGKEYREYVIFGLMIERPSLLIPVSACLYICKLMSVVLYLTLILAGLYGNSDPIYNISPTFVWVIWWVGVAYASAFIGNIWTFLNPWQIIFEFMEWLIQVVSKGKKLTPVLSYPDKISVWPALVLFLAFAWVENVYHGAVIPVKISYMILIYSAITFAGMVLFGKKIWLRNGETFTIVFRILSRFAPIVITRGQGMHAGYLIKLRLWGSGLLTARISTFSEMMFILSLLAVVTFDGFTATMPWVNLQMKLQTYIENSTVILTLGLGFTVVLFIAVYLGFCKFIALLDKNQIDAGYLAQYYATTLIPIALAYHVAHFLLFLLIQGQLIIPLLSDPLGFGWNILGTSQYQINLNLVSSTVYWAVSVVSIVVGHVIAVVLAHHTVVRTSSAQSIKSLSQYPMLVLMVVYTMASLWILTQPMYAMAM